MGTQISPESIPQSFRIVYKNFRNGQLLMDRPADIPAGYYSAAKDIETSRRDGIIRAPGVTLVEDTGHSLQWLGVQAGLGFQSLLLAFDPPYLGIKEAANFEWFDKGLSSGNWWVASNYGDILLFSNGNNSYARNYDTQEVELLEEMPGAATIFVAFGRVFAGATVLGNEHNLLGLIWNSAEGDYHDWTGLGSGSELLLVDAPQGDKIVAGRILSLNLVAILNRRSLWIGAKTDNPYRPLAPEFRIIGVGCVAEPTAVTTEGGVTFLSDEGIRHFDSNQAPIISGPINAELLPLDFSKIHLYKAAWDLSRRRYILTTPNATYVYQFPTSEYPNGAWFKRSLTATNVVVFAEQTEDPTWDDLGTQTWDDLGTTTWSDMETPESNKAPNVLFIRGSKYGLQDEASSSNFGIALNPIAQPRPETAEVVDMPDRVFLTQSLIIEYAGTGTVQFIVLDETGSAKLVLTKSLPLRSKISSVQVDLEFSSLGVGLYLIISEGSPEIFSIKQTALDNGMVVTGAEGPELLTEDAPLDVLTEDLDEVILWL